MRQLLCGVDLGGTKLAVGIVAIDGKLVDKAVTTDHIAKSETEVVNLTFRFIDELLARNGMTKDDLLGIGMGFPGHVKHNDGSIITTSNLSGFKNYPLRSIVAERYSGTIVVDNDANAQTFAEFMFGAGRHHDSMVFLSIGTGIGGGIIIDRKLYRGCTGTAGEFGHMIIDRQNLARCGCGNQGCLMACASGASLPQLFSMYRRNGMTTKLNTECISGFDGVELKKGLALGDEICERIISDYALYIGIGIYNIFQIFDPPLVVLGGGLINLGKHFLDKIIDNFRKLVRDMAFDETRIALSVLKEDAGVIGASALLMEGI